MNFTGSWKHNRKIKPWIKKEKKLFQNQTEEEEQTVIEEKVKDLAPSEVVRRLYTSSQSDVAILGACSLGAGPKYMAPLLAPEWRH